MKPTTDQVMTWAQEAGFYPGELRSGFNLFMGLATIAYAAGAAAMKERAAKVCEAEESRILSRQSGRDYDPVDTNLRMIACVLPDIAAAIRAQEDADE